MALSSDAKEASTFFLVPKIKGQLGEPLCTHDI